ncbi:uncharacterized protein LOC105662781 isoform X1 [Megachile rotundata]|uniref:uncharacterized protein LOC105662781 isoform X1 n=2 Tax=Megachile rotundata TaxID=143995 RepID=UPI003FD34C65
MNAFADNPFFFIVDNMPPISSVNASKNARRIVELSDTGCDARLSVSTLLRNATRYYSSESAKMRSKEYWKPRCEKKYTNIPLGERLRRRYEQDVMDAEESYLGPAEDGSQNYWQEYSMYDINEDVEHGRKSRIASERVAPRIPEYNGRYDHSVPQRVPNLPRSNSPFQPPFPKSKITTGRLQTPRFSYLASELSSYDRGRRRSMEQDYAEEFKELRHPRSHREHWQRNNEEVFDEIAHQSHNFSKYSRRPSSAKSSDVNETNGDNIRSAPRSPITDRRKRTQPISKTLYQNAESQYDIQASQDHESLKNNEGVGSSRSSEKLKRFVDRAVDKDSLSDILKSERLPKMVAERPVVKEEARSSFWEFISLEDDDDKKKAQEKKSVWPMKKRQTQNASVTAKIKKKSEQKSPAIKTIEEDVTERNNNKNSDEQTKLSTDLPSKEVEKTGMNFVEKTVACLKRKIEKPRVEEASNDVGQSCTVTTEKKIKSEGFTYSRLPIRIGRRMKLKNPISTRMRSNAEGCIGSKEDCKDVGVEPSVRSRTKPKAKSTLLDNVDGDAEAEYSKSLGNVLQVAEVNSYEHNGNLDGNQKGDENMMKNNVLDKPMYQPDEKLTKEEKLESTTNKTRIGSPRPLNMTGDHRKNETLSPRGRKLTQGSSQSKRIDITKNCLKDNCFLHVHDEENIVCNGYCTKDCGKSRCFQSRIPIAIKSRL